MTFDQAFATYGPDTIAISTALGIPEHEADRLVNQRMEQARSEKPKSDRKEYMRAYREANKERITFLRRYHNARIRKELREIKGALA